jgi:hypothetical protein
MAVSAPVPASIVYASTLSADSATYANRPFGSTDTNRGAEATGYGEEAIKEIAPLLGFTARAETSRLPELAT